MSPHIPDIALHRFPYMWDAGMTVYFSGCLNIDSAKYKCDIGILLYLLFPIARGHHPKKS